MVEGKRNELEAIVALDLKGDWSVWLHGLQSRPSPWNLPT